MSTTFKTISDKAAWDACIAQFDVYDFYHTYDYHKLSHTKEEQPLLISFEGDGIKIALPLLLRAIPETNYFDATSVYGYCGPLLQGNPNSEIMESFRELLTEFLKDQNVVSVFSRLNPYIPQQEKVLEQLGQMELLGQVVNIDLTKEVAEQRKSYNKSTKSLINKARRSTILRLAKDEQDIETFAKIYSENMQRLNAKDSYFFDLEYFKDFYAADGFKTDILMAFDQETNEPMAASMFVKTTNIVQYHLSGTREQFLPLAPARLLIDETRIDRTGEGLFQYFNLGGGLGGQQDSLFKFKSAFSKDFKDFKVWKFILQDDVYQNLVRSKLEALGADPEGAQASFFPLYRYSG